jgi:DNA-directed RNA polymerase subunit M/transcription elongation factor TFIIS
VSDQVGDNLTPRAWYDVCLRERVQTGAESTPLDGNNDLFFKCESCGTALVVDSAAAGMTLKCQRCGAPTTVPHSLGSADAARTPMSPERKAELQHHLKENESQLTEINGYINQLSIQLHRWQLRLQDLEKRNKELMSELRESPGSKGEKLRR